MAPARSRARANEGPHGKIIRVSSFFVEKRTDTNNVPITFQEMLLHALESRSEFRYWFKLGGEPTLKSYSVSRSDLEVIPDGRGRPGRSIKSHPTFF